MRQTLNRQQWGLLLLAFVALSALAVPSRAAADDKPAINQGAVVAKIGDEPVYMHDVDVALQEALRGRPVGNDAKATLQAEVLDRVIDRQLVVNYLERNKLSVSSADVDQNIAKVKAQLEQQKIPFQQILDRLGLDEDGFRKQLMWQLSWEKYLEKNLTDDALYDFFRAHQTDYDGTEVRVSHILFRPLGPVDEAVIRQTIAQAAAVRKQIEDGDLKFSDAVVKYSSGPSRHNGGDLGFFPRHGVMAEPFAAAAFKLKVGEISEPVVSIFGVHLIYVTEVKEGKKTASEVRNELKVPLAAELFEKIAKEERAMAKVEYTGAMPYFKPGTKEVVQPKPPAAASK